MSANRELNSGLTLKGPLANVTNGLEATDIDATVQRLDGPARVMWLGWDPLNSVPLQVVWETRADGFLSLEANLDITGSVIARGLSLAPLDPGASPGLTNQMSPLQEDGGLGLDIGSYNLLTGDSAAVRFISNDGVSGSSYAVMGFVEGGSNSKEIGVYAALADPVFTINGFLRKMFHAGNLIDLGTTQSSARTALALVPGTNVQAYSAVLASVASANTSTNGVLQGNGSGFSAAPLSISQITGAGTAAIANTGTSGSTVPLLNGANTWSAAQTFSQPPNTPSEYRVNGTKVVGARDTGWTASTGVSANKGSNVMVTQSTTLTAAPATYVQAYFSAVSTALNTSNTEINKLSARVRALEDMLRTHGVMN